LRAFRDAPENDERVNSAIYSKALIEYVCYCTWRLRLSKLRDEMGGCDRVSFKIHLEIMIR
jgi:hypothetical protein